MKNGLVSQLNNNQRNYLPLAGGTLQSTHNTILKFDVDSDAPTFLEFLNNGVSLGHLGFDGADKPIFRSTDGVYNSLFGEHNKPSGTYTGNGDATSRTIETGIQLGSAICLIRPKTGSSSIGYPFGIVTKNGYIAKKGTTVTANTIVYTTGGGFV